MGESYRDGMQQSQDGNNTDGGNKTKRSARNTTKRTLATEPERGTIRNILGRPNRVRQDKIRRIYRIEIQVNQKQTGILQESTRLHTQRKSNDSEHTNLIETEILGTNYADSETYK